MAVKTSQTDKIVQSLFDKIQEKKLEITKAEKPSWKTNCAFKNSQEGLINVQTISDPAMLVKILAHLISERNSYSAALVSLNLTGEFSWQGYTFEEWFSDIKTRLAKIHINKKKSDLKDWEERLDKLVSPERKQALELEALQKLIG